MLNIRNNAMMNKRDKNIPTDLLTVGELYLFHPTNRDCPPNESLWGIYIREESGEVYLESSTIDMHSFVTWSALPAKYSYSRLANRCELRDYMYNLGCAEATHNS